MIYMLKNQALLSEREKFKMMKKCVSILLNINRWNFKMSFKINLCFLKNILGIIKSLYNKNFEAGIMKKNVAKVVCKINFVVQY